MNITCASKKKRVAGLVTLILAVLLLNSCQQGGTAVPPPPDTPTEESVDIATEAPGETPRATITPTTPPTSTDTPTPVFQFNVFRETPNVGVGQNEPLPTMRDDGPAALPEGHKITTDQNGEALLQGELEGRACSIFIFSNGSITKGPCPASASTGGNTSCQTGSAAYRDCDALLIQTPSLEAFQVGTWSWITYLPEEQLTIVLTSDGTTVTRPVLDADGWVLSDEAMEVTAGTWMYTAPDDMLIEVPGVPAREVRPWDELEALLNQYPEIGTWMERAQAHADQADVPFPAAAIQEPTPVPGPDLITELEVRGPAEEVEGYEGADLIIPVSVRVFNRGDQPADIFKIAVWAVIPEGRRFVIPFASDGQIIFYPFTESPIPPVGEDEFRGFVLLNSETIPDRILLEAEADSCAGDEFFEPFCRVDEYDEENNISDQVEAVVR